MIILKRDPVLLELQGYEQFVREKMMFAVLKTGGKQYKVTAGDIIRVERLEGEAGKTLELPDILMIGDGASVQIGAPLLANSSIRATILEQTRNKTVIIYKKRRRQGYDRKNGHRQHVSLLHVDEIIHAGKTIAQATPPAPKAKETVVAKKKVTTKSVAPTKAVAKDKTKVEEVKDAKPEAATNAAPKKAATEKSTTPKTAAKKSAVKKTKE